MGIYWLFFLLLFFYFGAKGCYYYVGRFSFVFLSYGMKNLRVIQHSSSRHLSIYIFYRCFRGFFFSAVTFNHRLFLLSVYIHLRIYIYTYNISKSTLRITMVFGIMCFSRCHVFFIDCFFLLLLLLFIRVSLCASF
jgi:hypothetical protein